MPRPRFTDEEQWFVSYYKSARPPTVMDIVGEDFYFLGPPTVVCVMGLVFNSAPSLFIGYALLALCWLWSSLRNKKYGPLFSRIVARYEQALDEADEIIKELRNASA